MHGEGSEPVLGALQPAKPEALVPLAFGRKHRLRIREGQPIRRRWIHAIPAVAPVGQSLARASRPGERANARDACWVARWEQAPGWRAQVAPGEWKPASRRCYSRARQEVLRRRVRRRDPSGALWSLPTTRRSTPVDACEAAGDEQRARSAAVAIGVAIVALLLVRRRRTAVRIAPPSANRQRTSYLQREGLFAALRSVSAGARWWIRSETPAQPDCTVAASARGVISSNPEQRLGGWRTPGSRNVESSSATALPRACLSSRTRAIDWV
jgi:hypothetical protein